ncbi:MAG: hypothetical protein Q4A40_05435, partial [Bacillota bacterium]|nr:hypothetical protein [Bacillota bacterium]
ITPFCYFLLFANDYFTLTCQQILLVLSAETSVYKRVFVWYDSSVESRKYQAWIPGIACVVGTVSLFYCGGGDMFYGF